MKAFPKDPLKEKCHERDGHQHIALIYVKPCRLEKKSPGIHHNQEYYFYTIILDTRNVLLEEKGYIFLLTSRFTQDCVDNLFSAIHCKQLIPNAVQFKNNLKLITIAQYLCDVSKSSYESDNTKFLTEFLDNTSFSKQPKYSPVKLPSETLASGREFNNSEEHSLYNLADYLVSSIKRPSKCYSQCIDSAGSKTFVTILYSQFVKIQGFN